MIYGGVFLLGYFSRIFFSAWRQERFVANVLASNGFVAVLASWPGRRARPAERTSWTRLLVLSSPSGQPMKRPATCSAKLAIDWPSLRSLVSAIKNRYGNTLAEDEMLRRFLRDKLAEPAPGMPQSAPASAADDSWPRAAAVDGIVRMASPLKVPARKLRLNREPARQESTLASHQSLTRSLGHVFRLARTSSTHQERLIFAAGGRIPRRAGAHEPRPARVGATAVPRPHVLLELFLPELGERAGRLRRLANRRAAHR